MTRPTRDSLLLPRLFAVVLAALGFLPIVNWVPGGRSAPWYGTVASGWLSGSMIALGAGIVLAILTQAWTPGSARASAFAARAADQPLSTGVVAFALSLLVYAVVARTVFSGVPLHLDELAQVVQARIFAEGRLYMEAGAHPEFRSALHLLDWGGKWYSQFPPGGPLMLVPGVLLGATWLVGPVLGAFSVALFWAIIRHIEARPVVALASTAVFACAPFVVFMSASHMNHVAALFWALVATWAMTRQDDGIAFPAVAGFALGMLATVRPVDAVAFALPAGLWMLWRVRSAPRGFLALSAAGFGVAVPSAALLWYNARTTGQPLLFAYEALWGADHGLGFHAAPWGDAHTPARGLELLSLYALRLQTYLFETPFPSLVFVAAGLVFAKRLSLTMRYWLLSVALLFALYFSYWHDGFYLGPRFTYLASPLLAVLAVQGMLAMAERLPMTGLPKRAFWWSVAVAGAMALAINIPERAGQYARGLGLMRLDPTAPARAAGVRGALILVRESWGAQLVPRLWARGVSRPLTEAAYGRIDTCILDSALTDWEHRDATGAAVEQALVPLMGDSSRLAGSAWSPDGSERVLPGQPYGPTCVRRINEDRAGFTIFLPVLARDPQGNTYVRDLHARDSLLVGGDATRPLYLLRAASSDAHAGLVLERLSMDSLLAEWRSR